MRIGFSFEVTEWELTAENQVETRLCSLSLPHNVTKKEGAHVNVKRKRETLETRDEERAEKRARRDPWPAVTALFHKLLLPTGRKE